MPQKGVRLILLCEDEEHRRFVYHVLLKLGYHYRELRVITAPSGRGSAEKWVREKYPSEVKAYRSKAKHQKVGVVTIIDADTHTLKERHQQLDEQLQFEHTTVRQDNERIIIWIPRRNIETWVAFFLDHSVNEEKDFKNLVNNIDYRIPASKYVEAYKHINKSPDILLPSIRCSFEELKRLDL